MAITAEMSLSINGKDTTKLTLNGNSGNYIELIKSKSTTFIESDNFTVAAATAATSIASRGAVMAGVSNICFVMFITYSASPAEATPKVQVAIDGDTIEAHDVIAGMYGSTLTLATTSLANACEIQIFFYKGY